MSRRDHPITASSAESHVEAALAAAELTEPLLGAERLHVLVPVDDGRPQHDDESDDDDESRSFFNWLVFYRALYFLGGLSASTWGRFGIVYYNRVKHLSPSEIGILEGLSPVLSFLTQPIWGIVSDAIKSRKKVYVLCKSCSTVALLCLALDFVNSFWSILLCVGAMACFSSNGVLDAHLLDFLGERNRGMYGSIRLYCAISWGLGAVVMGWITDMFEFKLNFALFGTMMVLMLAATILGLPERSKSEQESYDRGAQSEGGSRPRPKVLARALCRGPIAFWLFEVSVIGACMSLVDSFLFVFLQNDLAASTRLCGGTVGITVLLEIPGFHYSKALLQRVGHDGLFIISMLAYALRVIGYTYLTPETVHWVLLLEVMHGLTFACMWVASIDYSAAVAPPEWSTTVQSILSTVLTCVGGGIGPILGGLVLEHFGAIVMYRLAAMLVGITLVVHVLFWLAFDRGHDSFLERLKSEREAEEDVVPLTSPASPSIETDEVNNNP